MKGWVLALGVMLALPVRALDFGFALFGDTPYTEAERARLPGMIAAMARQGNEFAVHVGDIKDGISPCSDELYRDRLRLFESSGIPLVYLPGDNEWTDCHRALAGRHDPLERLEFIRRLFFSDGQTLGRRRFDVERQPDVDKAFGEYRENQRWARGRILFVGINVPGSDNGFGEGVRPAAEFVARAPANRAWLESSFALARRDGYRVVFLMMQADPDFGAFDAQRQNLGYGEFLHILSAQTRAFPGRVVLVHGDSHVQRIDHPLREPRTHRAVGKFLRVETHGSPRNGWTRVTVRNADTDPVLEFSVFPW